MTAPPSFADRHRQLRALVASGRTIAAPGATDALSAKRYSGNG